MPYKVNSCFEYFNKNVVNLDSSQVPTAITSRDTLIGSMHSLSDRGLIPQSYSEKDMPFGSFARKTKIRPLNDIDLMICFSGCGGTWKYLSDDCIAITMSESAPVLSGLRNEDGTLNSRRLLENIKKELSQVRYYKKADIHRNQEAVTLLLSSYDWNFDIVPCFYASADFYLIPDGNGNWKKTDPRMDQKKTTDTNKLKDGKVLQLIRTMKYWKTIWWPTVSSYMFEQMILNASVFLDLNQPFSQQVCACFNWLSSQILGSIADPKGMQGDLNDIDNDKRKTLSNIAASCFEIANDAIIKELTELSHEESIQLWGKVFGSQFPCYGSY